MKFLHRFFRKKKENNVVEKLTRNMEMEIQNFLWGGLSDISVRVDDTNRPRSINVFLPGLSAHMSAGPLSILYFVKFLVVTGYHVRLLVDTVQPDSELRMLLHEQAADLDDAMDRVEVSSFQIRGSQELVVNSGDMSVATLFNTAYAAKQVQAKCRDKKFIYFIQDDEREFFAASSLKCVVENSYHWDYYPIFSTTILRDFFLSENVGNLASKNVPYIDQGCPANFFLPEFEEFKKRPAKKKFIFYARPQTSRNCFELAMYVINKAVSKGLFSSGWELYGMGFPSEEDITLSNGVLLHMLPNMPLDDYKKLLSSFDVGLSLMATPHPSMPPIDLAMSGCVVVTNSCKTKTDETMKSICGNIICGDTTVESLEKALVDAIESSSDIKTRYDNAKNAKWTRTWDDAFVGRHKEWIAAIMK